MKKAQVTYNPLTLSRKIKGAHEKLNEGEEKKLEKVNKSQIEKRGKIQQLKDENAEHKKELELVQSLNYGLQKNILCRSDPSIEFQNSFSSDESGAQMITFSNTESTALNSSNEQEYDSIQLHPEIMITKDQWDAVAKVKKGPTGDSMFIKKLATAVWGSEELVNRSVTGKRCNAIKDSAAKKRLTPKKLDAIKDQLRQRIRKENPKPSEDEIDKRVGKVNSYITEK